MRPGSIRTDIDLVSVPDGKTGTFEDGQDPWNCAELVAQQATQQLQLVDSGRQEAADQTAEAARSLPHPASQGQRRSHGCCRRRRPWQGPDLSHSCKMIREGPFGPMQCWLHSVVAEHDFVSIYRAQMHAMMLSFEIRWPTHPLTRITWMRDPRFDDEVEEDETATQMTMTACGNEVADEGVCETMHVGMQPAETGYMRTVELISSGNSHRHGSDTSQSSAMHCLHEPCTQCTNSTNCTVPSSSCNTACACACHPAPARHDFTMPRTVKKVSFAHTVEFWFPSSEQLCLPPASTCRPLEGCFPRRGMQRLPVVPPACPSYTPPAVLAVPRSNAKAKPRHLTVAKHRSQPVPPAVRPVLVSPGAATASTRAEAIPAEDHPLLMGDPPNPYSSFDEILAWFSLYAACC